MHGETVKNVKLQFDFIFFIVLAFFNDATVYKSAFPLHILEDPVSDFSWETGCPGILFIVFFNNLSALSKSFYSTN